MMCIEHDFEAANACSLITSIRREVKSAHTNHAARGLLLLDLDINVECQNGNN